MLMVMVLRWKTVRRIAQSQKQLRAKKRTRKRRRKRARKAKAKQSQRSTRTQQHLIRDRLGFHARRGRLTQRQAKASRPKDPAAIR
jgi:hypothetical protein